MANLARPICPSDIVAAAGPWRMLSGARFRVTTGLPPHEYLQGRRTKQAQALLLNSDLPLVEITFDAGFRAQSRSCRISRDNLFSGQKIIPPPGQHEK